MSKRWEYTDEYTGHGCCYTYSVIDKSQPIMIGDKQYKNEFDAIAEVCTEIEAKLLTEALNIIDDFVKSGTTKSIEKAVKAYRAYGAAIKGDDAEDKKES